MNFYRISASSVQKIDRSLFLKELKRSFDADSTSVVARFWQRNSTARTQCTQTKNTPPARQAAEQCPPQFFPRSLSIRASFRHRRLPNPECNTFLLCFPIKHPLQINSPKNPKRKNARKQKARTLERCVRRVRQPPQPPPHAHADFISVFRPEIRGRCTSPRIRDKRLASGTGPASNCCAHRERAGGTENTLRGTRSEEVVGLFSVATERGLCDWPSDGSESFRPQVDIQRLLSVPSARQGVKGSGCRRTHSWPPADPVVSADPLGGHGEQLL